MKQALEELRIKRIEHVRQRAVAWNVIAEGQAGAKKIEMPRAPIVRLDLIVGTCDAGRQHTQHGLGQRNDDLAALARVFELRKMAEQRDPGRLLRTNEHCGPGGLH